MVKKKTNKKHLSLTQKIILIIIAIATVITAIVFIIAATYNPEASAHSKIESMAAKYYKDVYYESMLNSKHYSGKPETALSKYVENGLPSVSLRQLINLTGSNKTEDANFLLDHCNENATYVRFYPEEPYTNSSYHADFVYSCDF